MLGVLRALRVFEGFFMGFMGLRLLGFRWEVGHLGLKVLACFSLRALLRGFVGLLVRVQCFLWAVGIDLTLLPTLNWMS